MARKVLIQIYHGLEMNIGNLNSGELGYCTDTKKLYIGTTTGNVLLVASQTAGDMLKSIYDTDNDGIVDAAESVPWGGVSGKPSTFTPSTHSHTKSQISDFPTSLPANGGNADTVNGKTVLENVPAGAKFTDTVYTHPGSGTNPHGTTKSDVGLGSVNNYGIATQVEAETGTSNTKYMTPLSVKQAIDANSTVGTVTWGQLKGV